LGAMNLHVAAAFCADEVEALTLVGMMLRRSE
jgi:hypothetical protein